MCPFLFCNHLNGEERAGCFALFVFQVLRDCCVALPHDAMGCMHFVIVVFPDETHYFNSVEIVIWLAKPSVKTCILTF